MSTSYTSTVEVNVWKEHTCVSCGTGYRYMFKRTKSGQGATPDAASEAAYAAVEKSLSTEVDLQPCPGCGMYQPDMIADQRSGRHWWTFWCGLPVFALVIILILTDVVSATAGAFTLAIAGGLLLLINLVIDAINPNGNLDANHRLAKDREEAGDLWVPRKTRGETGGAPVGTGVGAGHYVGYGLLLVGALMFLAPALLLIATGGRSNPDWVPEVMGPGDKGYVYFSDAGGSPTRVTSVKGLWSASPVMATITNLAELGLQGQAPTLIATSKTDSWAGTITVSSKGGTTSSPRLWAYVQLPPDDRLVGKTLTIQINMHVRYPQMMGSTQYRDTSGNFTHTARLRVSGRNAGSTYQTTWWVGTMGGLLLTVVGGIVLPLASSAFRKKANPTEIFVPDQPDGLPDAPLEDDDRLARDDDDRYRGDDDDRPRRRSDY